MQSHDKFSFLRSILRTLGLSAEAVDDIVGRISDWLSEIEKPPEVVRYPYFIRDDFLSAAELSFYLVLKLTVGEKALICPKVALGDLFWVKSSEPSEYRSLTNKIDRKHVDFLLCDPKTVRPLAGIELDDKSHHREARQQRDEFVGNVFAAAKLPLIRVPVKHAYAVSELVALLRPYMGLPAEGSAPVSEVTPAAESVAAPRCPKCGSEMVLRTAKNGINQGNKFWGCSNFPRCRGILAYEDGAKSPVSNGS
jgi:predicted RNA-binding Zn-ribbon protein involved in translation (DUF1610 family)